jgi:hypothetical protein
MDLAIAESPYSARLYDVAGPVKYNIRLKVVYEVMISFNGPDGFGRDEEERSLDQLPDIGEIGRLLA